MIYILIFALCFGLTACGDGVSNRDLQKILVENGLSQSEVKDVKVEKVINLENAIKGLDSSDYNKLILFNHDNKYIPVIVNTKTQKLTDTVTKFVPLNVIYDEFQVSDLDTNIKNMIIYKKYLEKYGLGCLENAEYAREYLREVTGKNGIIDTAKARKIVSNSAAQTFPNINSADDITILFEDDNAVPMYYIGAETKMAYNWNGIFPENVYNVWKANADSRTQQTMMALYGQPYAMRTVWVALDKDLNRLGTYSSLNDAKNKLLSKNKKDKTEDKNKNNEQAKDKNNEQAKDKNNEQINDSLFRVRKSASDAASQVGAFKILDNAKKTADAHKAEGYKVYDSKGNLVYEP